jgi:hypothetical protein
MSAANFFYSKDLVQNWAKGKTPCAEIAKNKFLRILLFIIFK